MAQAQVRLVRRGGYGFDMLFGGAGRMLHRVPAILFGRSDLRHCAETVQRPEDWPRALQRALTTDWPYDAFLLWFLRRQNIDASRPFLGQILDRMAAQGADFAALGITRPTS